MIKISPSVLTSDFLTLKDDIKKLESAGVDMLHLDVMDGIFVPNISFGPPVIRSIRKHTNLPLDIHLMIDRPNRYFKEFISEADYLGFHYEAGSDVSDLLKAIRNEGKKSCLTIKPATDPEEIFDYLPLCDMVLVMSVEPGFGGQKFMPIALEKLKTLKEISKIKGYNIELEVDGGINAETAPETIKAGADVLVIGNYLFSAEDMAARVKEIKEL
ncbi:MAG: ribulose-phosphate 3-epimerase [Acutalibacteraceae bacterium]|nr:ribulose-phosphate 3-epimerase [Acutalibacteraceae bacterium]